MKTGRISLIKSSTKRWRIIGARRTKQGKKPNKNQKIDDCFYAITL
jgi:hypothetical protein